MLALDVNARRIQQSVPYCFCLITNKSLSTAKSQQNQRGLNSQPCRCQVNEGTTRPTGGDGLWNRKNVLFRTLPRQDMDLALTDVDRDAPSNIFPWTLCETHRSAGSHREKLLPERPGLPASGVYILWIFGLCVESKKNGQKKPSIPSTSKACVPPKQHFRKDIVRGIQSSLFFNGNWSLCDAI